MSRTLAIRLTKGFSTRIDAADLSRLPEGKWQTLVTGGHKYAYRTVRVAGQPKQWLYLHRVLASPPAGLEVDHINGDTLDNRSANLRVCTHAENQRNSKKRTGKNGKFKGAFLHRPGQWHASIQVAGKVINLGSFRTQTEAARAYDIGAKKYHGEFARTNFAAGGSRAAEKP